MGVRDARRWWARIRTSRPESLRLIVRTRHGAFWRQTIVNRAGLRPWAELHPPLDHRGDRVTVRWREQDDEIWFELVSPEEYGQPGFRALLADLLARFLETIR